MLDTFTLSSFYSFSQDLLLTKCIVEGAPGVMCSPSHLCLVIAI